MSISGNKNNFKRDSKKAILFQSPNLHSCGYIVDILDGLIESKLNVIQMDQQENMDVENLSNRFGGHICF
ncbi:MAG TPA: hypothetical protein P5150_02550 [Candidatus Ratteibacteria bacterium]|nr:hypothetical protein [bacterium]HRR95598.1 hypothetical protein [Candidatus Ratteibacteria bacterium]